MAGVEWAVRKVVEDTVTEVKSWGAYWIRLYRPL